MPCLRTNGPVDCNCLTTDCIDTVHCVTFALISRLRYCSWSRGVEEELRERSGGEEKAICSLSLQREIAL